MGNVQVATGLRLLAYGLAYLRRPSRDDFDGVPGFSEPDAARRSNGPPRGAWIPACGTTPEPDQPVCDGVIQVLSELSAPDRLETFFGLSLAIAGMAR